MSSQLQKKSSTNKPNGQQLLSHMAQDRHYNLRGQQYFRSLGAMLVSVRFPTLFSLFLPTGMCILIAVSIYTARFTGRMVYSTNPHHGYCFILAWICFCFSFIIGILYLVLRKK